MDINTFKAFGSRNYRLYFAGQSVSLIGTWMQKTAVSWVIYTLTHSTFMLGLTMFASQFPSFVLSLFGGVVSDRYNRFRVLLTTQVASMIQATILAVLVLLKHYAVWEILTLSVILGVINAFDVPARQSLVYEMIEDKHDLPNALALNSSMVNLSRLIGPAIAGFILEMWGDGFCFLLNAVSFIAVLGSLLLMKLPPYIGQKHTKNVVGELKEGFTYLKSTPSITFVIMMLGLISLLVLPFSTLIPYYAREVFKGNATTFGVIDSVIGLGAFSGAIFLASLKGGSNLKKILSINTLIFGIGLVLFSHESTYWLALVFATIAGFGMMSQITISNTLIQTSVDPNMRGRVISFYAMAYFGLQPIGGLLVGLVSKWIGAPDTILFEGIAALLIGLLHIRFLRKEKLKQQDNVIAVDEHHLQAAV
ncbi:MULTISPECIES: MFS transporter [unclassified Mucilaginibacter]|uniref:MFS transporter n=1 Tax=unclassified Mucilaginibacter TaxID=2617802 RepID=UPI000960F67A|nr:MULTISPECIES: MFS transporter [unclassified Mucilaginibacter]OJW17411.1 MAG: MFS transporter [Mucilaginibacter sp. 44-25]PLW90627.1 MAG: MFS transporter [Mucilaginibacter sp.]PMP65955.1 MAG: MFS transporter [Mucilaginibacter sp.]HEK19228.1 MFS transporter [Bacteroidota bacterium]